MRALRPLRQRALITAFAALAAGCATTMPAATPTAPPATVTQAPTPEPTATPAVTASLPPADSPSPAPTPELETLPQGAVVDIARASVSRAIGFWPPAAYGGWDEPTDEGYELVVETSDELIVLDGRSVAVLHTLERPSVAQINAVLVTWDLPSRVVGVDNTTNMIERTFALTTTPPPFDMAAVIGDSMWVIDVEAAEVQIVPLGDL